MAGMTYVQRLKTVGGVVPATRRAYTVATRLPLTPLGKGISKMIDALAKVAAAPTDGTFDQHGLLVEGMQAGSEEALASLYQATVAKLHALAVAILRNAADAEEVVGATYIQAWESASQFDRERGPAIAWLMMMCRNRALDVARRHHHANRRARACARRIPGAGSRRIENDGPLG
jgi:hypothetical protein